MQWLQVLLWPKALASSNEHQVLMGHFKDHAYRAWYTLKIYTDVGSTYPGVDLLPQARADPGMVQGVAV